MADRAFVFSQHAQLGLEATPGTQVTPSKALQSMDFVLTPDPMVGTYRPAGYLWPTVGVTNYEETKFAMKGQGVFDELQYLYSGLFARETISTPGGATNARDWDYSVSTSAANAIANFTIEAGDLARAWRAGYLQFAEGGWTVDLEKGMQLTGGGFAQKIADEKYLYITRTGSPTTGTWSLAVTTAAGTQTATGLSRTITNSALQTALEALSNVGSGNVAVSGGALGTATLIVHWIGTFATADSPSALVAADTFDTGDVVLYRISPDATALPMIPIAGSYFDVYTASAQSGLAGATALTRAFDLDFKVTSRFSPIKPLNTSNNGTYAATVEATPTGTFKFSVGADAPGFAYLTTLRANSKLFVRVKATGPTIETGQVYLFQQDMCLILKKPSALKDGGGLVQIDFEGDLSHDSTWGKALSAKIRNTQTAL